MRLRKSDMSLVKTLFLYDFENLAKKHWDQAFYYTDVTGLFKKLPVEKTLNIFHFLEKSK